MSWLRWQGSSRERRSRYRERQQRGRLFELLEARRLLTAPHPFDVSALNGSNGFAILGAAAGDDSGRSASGAGDINGDGFDDLLVGSDGADPHGDLSGEAYLILGSPTSSAISLEASSLNGVGGFVLRGAAAFDQTGLATSSLGDINGDGFDDFIIGALSNDGAGADAGRSYVVFGRGGAVPSAVELQSLDGSQGFSISGAAEGDFSGASVSSAGDVNGDGISDILIGAPSADSTNQNDAGAAYVVFGRTTPFPSEIALADLDGNNGFSVGGAAGEDAAGFAVSSAGDFDGDGIDDILIGAYGVGQTGAAYIVFGRPVFGARLSLSALDGADGMSLFGRTTGDFTGWALSGAGDVNGDGFDDVILGAYGAAPSGRTGAGRSYVVFGSGSPPDSLQLASLDGGNGFAIAGAAAGDESGRAVAGAGDVNGDGFDDLLIGARRAAPNSTTDAGAGYLLFGKASAFAANLELSSLDGNNGFRIDSGEAGGLLGLDTASAGDVNGDGFDDLLITAPAASPDSGRPAAGKSFLIYGADFLDAVTQSGDASDNLLAGNAQRNVMVAGAGDDTLVGAGGADVLRGGAGDDLLAISDMGFARLAGGRGVDTLRFDGSGLILDLRLLPDNRLTGIERIDMIGSGSNTLELDLREVLNLSDTTNELLIRAAANDDLSIGPGWTEGAAETVDGERYRTFAQGAAKLLLLDTGGPPWQNTANPLDVNGDGVVAPVGDVLPLINELNRPTIIDAGGNLPLPPMSPNLPPPFYDVSGDGRLTPVADVLPVINFLNSGGGGEGERALGGRGRAPAEPVPLLPAPVETGLGGGQAPAEPVPLALLGELGRDIGREGVRRAEAVVGNSFGSSPSPLPAAQRQGEQRQGGQAAAEPFPLDWEELLELLAEYRTKDRLIINWLTI